MVVKKMPAQSIRNRHESIRQTDRQAFAMAKIEGISFFEAWRRILDRNAILPSKKG